MIIMIMTIMTMSMILIIIMVIIMIIEMIILVKRLGGRGEGKCQRKQLQGADQDTDRKVEAGNYQLTN